MRKAQAARRAIAVFCSALVASFAMAGAAFAADVHGVDFYGTGSTLESGEIDVLGVDGAAGETVFITVSRGGTQLAKNLPYTIGQDASGGDQSTWAGVATLDIANLDLQALDGSYTVAAYDNRAGSNLLYEGALYGVYADLPDGTSKLIGTRTANASESSRAFAAPESLYAGGLTLRLVGQGVGEGVLHFAYEEYDEATTVDGVVKYVDSEGNVIASSPIPGIAYGEERAVDIPSVVVADNGDVYRTVFFKESVTAKNPGSVSFSIYCAKVSDADKALAGYYVATIQMVDEDGAVIASDSVDVTGNFIYTAPTAIYKTETVGGQATVVTYDVKSSPTIYLSAQADGVTTRQRTVQVNYAKQPLDQPQTDVTFNLLDGSKRVGEAGRTLGTLQATVSEDEPTAVPETEVQSGDATYHLAGDPSDYAYTFRSGDVPSINVYYLPEGYQAPGPYEVTVNYVNFATDQVIESHAYTSDPNDLTALAIDTPGELSADGVDYVRLAGQEAAIQHSYYSGIASYTVYYRDVNDTLTSGTVINTIRVVYRDAESTAESTASASGGTATTTTTTTTTTATTTAEGAASQPASADGPNAAGATAAGGDAAADAGADAGQAAGDAVSAAANAGAAGNDAQSLQLNDARTYNVFDGEGNNSSMTNESGVDPNTERIEDSETPLSSGFDRGGASSAAASLTQMTSVLVPLVLGLAIVAVIAFLVIRRRTQNESNEA